MTLSEAIAICEQMQKNYDLLADGDCGDSDDLRLKSMVERMKEKARASRIVLDAAKTRQRQTEEALKLLRELNGELN